MFVHNMTIWPKMARPERHHHVHLVNIIKYRLFNVLCWLWNIYEGAELPSVYFITNTKHCITYLAMTQLFPVLVSHPEMYTLCSILLHFV